MTAAFILTGLLFLTSVVAIVLFTSRRRAAACVTLGGALASTAVVIAVVWALNPDPGTNATGLALWGLLVAAAAAASVGAWRPRARVASFALGLLSCLSLIAAGAYLIAAFRIF